MDGLPAHQSARAARLHFREAAGELGGVTRLHVLLALVRLRFDPALAGNFHRALSDNQLALNVADLVLLGHVETVAVPQNKVLLAAERNRIPARVRLLGRCRQVLQR